MTSLLTPHLMWSLLIDLMNVVVTSHTAVTNSVTSNTVNMPMLKQFDVSKVSGLLCGANINCGTINVNSSN